MANTNSVSVISGRRLHASIVDISREQTYQKMKDKLALSQIDNLTANDYITAFTIIHEQMPESDFNMLEAHYESPNYDITATQLASKAGFPTLMTANLRYGLLARKLLQFFQIHLESYVKINILVLLKYINGEWHWTLRPQVVQALSELKWFEGKRLNIFQEIELHKDSYDNLSETTRESVIHSRIGQGQFRKELVEYWQGCSITGCKEIELLRASHIKPWRDSSNSERLYMYNGLLFIPNLDACFDLGLISFSDEGNILVSTKLNASTLLLLGINSALKLLRIEKEHRYFLQYHREKVFRC